MTPPATKVRVEPAIRNWSSRVAASPDRDALLTRINARAKRLGAAELSTNTSPLIATGHQAQLWHPGILAKDIAMDLAAGQLGAAKLHVIVDQDTHDVWRLDVPTIQGDQLQVNTLSLAPHRLDVPTGYQPPVDVRMLVDQLTKLHDESLEPLRSALEDMPDCASLAEQVAVVLTRLKRPYAGDVPIMLVSDLAGLPAYESIVTRMLHDAHACAAAYNQAVAQHPQAGMSLLVMTREFVELPIWAVRVGQPRRRVLVDLADHEPMFVFDDGEPIDRSVDTLLPRALLFTAVMRSSLCDLFIHGTGGLVYDRITEQWWQQWAGEALAPMAGVTADVYLDFDVPVSDSAARQRAVWKRHHLPHNLDRVLGLDDELTKQKQTLLAHMHDDRDRSRRRKAFKQIHQINEELAHSHPEAIEAATAELKRTEIGLANARVARRRDWCFALYPPEKLHELRARLAEHAGSELPGAGDNPGAGPGTTVQCPT